MNIGSLNGMTMTLTLTGSASALAAAIHAFEKAGGETVEAPEAGNPRPEAQNASTSTGAGTPVDPVSHLSAPTSAAPMPTAPSPSTSDDDSEEGEDGNETDGTGLDADGLPWDERIHSSNKKQGADGTWHKRRGGPKGEELEAIEAELRAATGGVQSAPAAPEAPAAPTAPEAPAAPTAPAPTAPMPPAAPVAAPAAPTPPMPASGEGTPVPPTPEAPATPAPAAPVAPQQPATEADETQGWDFAKFLNEAGPRFGEGEGQLSAQYLATVCAVHGIPDISALATKPELIPAIVGQFQADGRW